MGFTRREFVTFLAAGAGSALLPLNSFAALQKNVSVGRRLVVAGNNHVYGFDADTLKPFLSVKTGFVAHSFMLNPLDADELWTIQKYNARNGSYKSVYSTIGINMKQGRVTRRINAPEYSEYRGHGFFMPGTDTLFIGRVDKTTQFCHLTGYDVRSGKVLEDYKIAKCGIHDVQVMQDGTALAAISGAFHSSSKNDDGTYTPFMERTDNGAICRVDMNNGKILSRSVIADDEQLVGHFQQLTNKKIIAVSRSVAADLKQESGPSGRIFFGNEGEELKALTLPQTREEKQKPGEMFSIAIHANERKFVVSDYVNEVVFMFDAKTGECTGRKKLDVYALYYDAPTERFIVCGRSVHGYDSALEQEKMVFHPTKTIKGDFTGSHAVAL